MTYVKNLIYGAIIGLAEIIPGVSGGTFAVLLGIYDNLIGAISRFRKNIKKNLKLLIPLVLGMGISVVGLSFVIKFLLERFPMAVNFFFLGLVLGIVPMLYQKSTQKGFREANLVPFFITLAAMAALGVYAITTGDSDAVIRQISLPVFLKFMAVGCLAAVCLLLPGISGSMIMVIFGTYHSVITAISEMNILILLPVGVGVLIGLLFGAKLIDLALRKAPAATYSAILGLVLGSTVSIVANAGINFDSPQWIAAAVTLVVGAAISYVFSNDTVLKRRKKDETGLDV